MFIAVGSRLLFSTLTERNAFQPLYQIIQIFLVLTKFMMMSRRLKLVMLWKRFFTEATVNFNVV